METYCSVTTCNRENCGNQEQLCSFDITIPIKDGTFPMIEEGNNTGNLTKSVTWSQQGTQRGIVLVQLQNSKQVRIANELLFVNALS